MIRASQCCRSAGYVGILRGQFLQHFVPQHIGVPLGVALGGHRQLLAPRAGQLKAVAENPLDALAAVQGRLHGDFVGRAPLQPAAVIDVFPFAVLADDDEVDIAGPLPASTHFTPG